MKDMRAETRRRGFRNRTDMSLTEIAEQYNPVFARLDKLLWTLQSVESISDAGAF